MAIKAFIDEAGFTALDDGVKALYEKTDTGYALAVEDMDSHPAVHGIKKNRDELLAEKKAADKAKREAEQAAILTAEEEAKKRGEYEQLYKSSEEQRNKLAADLEEIKGSIAREKVNNEALKLAASLASDPWRQELLVEQITKRLALTDEGIKIKAADGSLTVAKMADLAKELQVKYPGLVDGSKASGAGADGKQSTRGAQKQVISRADFDSKSLSEQAQFIRSGGSVKD